MKRRQESLESLRERNSEDHEKRKKKDSSVLSAGKIKREIRNVKRLLSKVEVTNFMAIIYKTSEFRIFMSSGTARFYSLLIC